MIYSSGMGPGTKEHDMAYATTNEKTAARTFSLEEAVEFRNQMPSRDRLLAHLASEDGKTIRIGITRCFSTGRSEWVA